MLSSSRSVSRRVALVAGPLTALAMSMAAGSGIADAATVQSTGLGLPPTAIAVDSAAHTAYVAVTDGNSDQVAVVSTTTDAVVSTVQLADQSAPAAIAFDSANSTVYIAESNSGALDAIDETACNATVTTGCTTAPATVATLTSPDAIAVDTSSGNDAIYVADAGTGTVTVLGGATCDATLTSGCTTTQTVTVGDAPSAIAIDPALSTVYVANLADDTVSVINETDCSSLAAACSTDVPGVQTLDAGAAPLALAVSLTSPTVYVAESGTAEIGLVDAMTCNSAVTTGCATAAATSPVGTEPDAVTAEAGGFLAVGDGAVSGVKVFNGASCKAGTTSGCTKLATQPSDGTVVALAAAGSTIYAADSGNSSLDVLKAATNPSIKATLKSAHAKTKYGWYRSNVTVSFTCTAGTNSISSGSCPTSVTVSKSAKNQKVTRTVTASDGGTASVTVSINLDKVKPKVTIKGVKSGHTYQKAPKLKCSASDSLSGIASCTITKKTHGKTVDYTAKATDKAGNVKSVYGHYKKG